MLEYLVSKLIVDSYSCLGTFRISIENLKDPPDYLRVRDVKEWYVKLLMSMLKEESEDYEDLTSPLLVICSVPKDSFKQKSTGDYTYQVIGGVQRFTAISRINEAGERKIHARRCAVYGKGLSTKAILQISQKHNQVNLFQRSTTFPEIAGICRRLAFVHFAEGRCDDGEYDPAVPRYNTQKYREWKKECLQVCLNSQVVGSIVDGCVV